MRFALRNIERDREGEKELRERGERKEREKHNGAVLKEREVGEKEERERKKEE